MVNCKSKIKKDINNYDDNGNVKKSQNYYIYIIECENDKLYTGITTDYKRRFNEHLGIEKSDKGAKFTKCYKPIKIMALWKTNGRSSATKLECRIKRLRKEEKNLLIETNKYFKLYFNSILNSSEYRRIALKK